MAQLALFMARAADSEFNRAPPPLPVGYALSRHPLDPFRITRVAMGLGPSLGSVPDSPLMLIGGPWRLHQAFGTLLGKAVKFTAKRAVVRKRSAWRPMPAYQGRRKSAYTAWRVPLVEESVSRIAGAAPSQRFGFETIVMRKERRQQFCWRWARRLRWQLGGPATAKRRACRTGARIRATRAMKGWRTLPRPRW
jgi:hypothetical protein